MENKIVDLKKEIEENKIREKAEELTGHLTPIEFNAFHINELYKTVEDQGEYIIRLITVIESYEERLQRLADEVYRDGYSILNKRRQGSRK